MRRVDHVRSDRQIVVEEFGAQRVVGDDAADLGGREKHRLRTPGGEPSVHRGLIAQVELAPSSRDELDTLLRKPAYERRSDHAAMPGDENRLALQLKRNACH